MFHACPAVHPTVLPQCHVLSEHLTLWHRSGDSMPCFPCELCRVVLRTPQLPPHGRPLRTFHVLTGICATSGLFCGREGLWEDRALKAQAPGRAVHGCLLLWVGCVGPTFCSLPPSQMALCPVLLAVAGWLAFCQRSASLASGSCVVWLKRGLSHVGSPPFSSSPDLTIHVPGQEDPRLCTPHHSWWQDLHGGTLHDP